MTRRQLTTADLAGQGHDEEDDTSNHPGGVVAVVDVLGILRWDGDPLRLVVGRVRGSSGNGRLLSSIGDGHDCQRGDTEQEDQIEDQVGARHDDWCWGLFA